MARHWQSFRTQELTIMIVVTDIQIGVWQRMRMTIILACVVQMMTDIK